MPCLPIRTLIMFNSDIHNCWVIPRCGSARHLILDDVNGTINILKFTNSDTYFPHNTNFTKRNLDPSFKHWRNSWFHTWGLATRALSDFDTYDDGSHFFEYPYQYKAGQDGCRVFSNPKKDLVGEIKARCELADDVVIDGRKGFWELIKEILLPRWLARELV
jgi:hypothetical protein